MITKPANTCRRISRVLAVTAGISSLPAQVEYQDDGIPTPLEEEIRWHTNRARFDTARENAARGTSYTDVPATSGPLAPHESLSRAARRHSEDMAKRNKFQHETVSGSAYYNASTQPDPWDRFEAEGYHTWNWLAENISAGQSSAEAAHTGWWKSSGHRRNLCSSSAREIGNGYFYRSGSAYGHYYTMDLGGSLSAIFFTDTLFIDANRDGTCDGGEGVSGVQVCLMVGGVEHGWFDTSAAAGNFAIPLNGVRGGSFVEVWLTNRNTHAVEVSLPRDYSRLDKLTLPPGVRQLAGTIICQGGGNAGFRNLTPAPEEIPVPVLTLTRDRNVSVLSWPSQTGLQFLLQWSSDLSSWVDLGGYQNGSGGVMTRSDTTSGSASCRFYRLVVRRP